MQQWLVTFYTKDSVLFEVHLLHQLKRACEIVNGDFIFISFQEKDSTPLVRRVMEEQLQLKEQGWPSRKMLKLFHLKLMTQVKLDTISLPQESR